MTYNFCYMYGLNYIDVPQLTRFTDITSSDPYPTATLSHFGKERALYHTGFATKYLKELSKKPVATMPQGFIYCGMGAYAGTDSGVGGTGVEEWSGNAVLVYRGAFPLHMPGCLP